MDENQAPGEAKMPQASQAEEALRKLEDQASRWLQSVQRWVNQGDELLTRSRQWLDEHPVSRDLAEKAVRKAQEIRETGVGPALRQQTEGLRGTANRGVGYAKQNPMETLAIGAVVALAAALAIRSMR